MYPTGSGWSQTQTASANYKDHAASSPGKPLQPDRDLIMKTGSALQTDESRDLYRVAITIPSPVMQAEKGEGLPVVTQEPLKGPRKSKRPRAPVANIGPVATQEPLKGPRKHRQPKAPIAIMGPDAFPIDKAKINAKRDRSASPSISHGKPRATAQGLPDDLSKPPSARDLGNSQVLGSQKGISTNVRTKTKRSRSDLITFDPTAHNPIYFDSIIYRQSRLRPPPGIKLFSRIVQKGLPLYKGKQVFLPVNPAIHRLHNQSQHWYKRKCEEIRRRPRRKAWFGKFMARKRWLLAEASKVEGNSQNPENAENVPPFKPPEPRAAKKVLDFGDVPEEELPDYVRSNPAWLKACAWFRECEAMAAVRKRHVDKSTKEAERFFQQLCGGN
ncbi:hypothetical protein LB507_007205 [Fusarium sp. FIESC RH6]|nr:hypothetical protein LB507_007205 [Fusarium sp. FIESC RH6]